MIRLESITKTFDEPALAGVDLHVPAGCLFGLVGPGGSGKSVVLKTIASLVRPDGGLPDSDDEPDVLAIVARAY